MADHMEQSQARMNISRPTRELPSAREEHRDEQQAVGKLGTSLPVLWRKKLEFGRLAPGESLLLQRAIGNQALGLLITEARQRGRISEPWPNLQRADGTDNDDSQPSPPACAPPVFQYDFDPVPQDSSQASTDQPAANSYVQTSLDGSRIQRQATGGTGTSPSMIIAQTLSWSDFPPVPNRINGKSAQTGWRSSWRTDGTGFNITFDSGGSWSIVADQTDSLLRHEQYHLNLAVLVANKANAASGTMKAGALIAAFKKALEAHNRAYENDTKNGTDARMQSMWESDIDAGVPEFPITPMPPN